MPFAFCIAEYISVMLAAEIYLESIKRNPFSLLSVTFGLLYLANEA